MIALGLMNFLAYTLIYAELGGDAKNGGIEIAQTDDGQPILNDAGEPQQVYYIKGHFIHGAAGQRSNVSRWVWIYSYVHSISLWPTQGMLMICMLILAQPHIIATMSEDSWIKGQTFIAVAITLVAVFYSAMSVWFVLDFVGELQAGPL